jgi:hypothetical protein
LRTDAKTKIKTKTYLFKIEGSFEVLHRTLLIGVWATVSREPDGPPLVVEEEDEDSAAPESSIFSAELAT